MQIQVLKSKIHRATVTNANLNYEGSLTIDKKLMALADIFPGEQVQVLNLSTGKRIETYAITGKPGSGIICLNGPAARTGLPGDKVIILTYTLLSEQEYRSFNPKFIKVDNRNKPLLK